VVDVVFALLLLFLLFRFRFPAIRRLWNQPFSPKGQDSPTLLDLHADQPIVCEKEHTCLGLLLGCYREQLAWAALQRGGGH